jgi:hypothetical protein
VAADDHFHQVVRCAPERAGLLAGGIVRSLRSIVPVEVERPHVRPVENRRHLSWLVGYCVKQPEHHGIDVDAALWSGSCFQDLVGARRLPRYRPDALKEALPRLHLHDVLAMLGLEAADLRCTDDDVRQAGAQRVLEAAASAVAAGPALANASALSARAKALAIRVGSAAGLSRRELGWVTGLTRQRVAQVLRVDVDAELVVAVRRRLALESAVRARKRAA